MQQRLTVEEIAAKLKPIFGKKIDDIYLRYAMADTKEEREEIVQIINALYHKHLSELLEKKVLLEPPSEDEMDGEYPLAMISYAGKQLYDFKLREQDWPRHVCITGMSGSGKTTFAFHIIQNFIDKGKPFLIFDWKKSFRPLISVDSEIMDFTIGNEAVTNLFKMNINEPPEEVNPKEWINVLCDLIVESFMVSFGVHKVLLEALDEAFREWGVYQGSNNYPTWNHIKWRLEQKLNKVGGRESGWLESALRIATVLTFGSFGKVLNYKGEDKLSVEQLLNKKVIFELNSLSNIEKKFFSEFVLMYIYKLKKARQISLEGKFDHAIVVDEAHNIFLKEKTHFVKESVTDMIYREMREYGTALVCLDQHISKLSDTVKGNSATHIAFQQQLPADLFDISGIMQLGDRKEFFSKLPVGSAIVKLAERYTSPFLIEVAEAKLRKKSVANQEVKKRMQAVALQRDVEEGKDEEFRKQLIEDPRIREAEEQEEEVRVPDHALYDGELEEAKEAGFKKKSKKKKKEKQAEQEAETETITEPQHVKKHITPIFYPTGLTPVQERLLEFVEQQLALGKSMAEIEKIMEYYPNEGLYTFEDVSKVINYVLASRFNKIKLERNLPEFVTTEEKQKVYKDKNPPGKHRKLKDITGQKRFLAFLQANPKHNLSTVEIYKKLGLSARKGTRIKNELLEQRKIIIKEEKNKKGWKKIIQLA